MLPPSQEWYCYKELGPGGMLLTPMTDPWQYEHPFDYTFVTPEEARQFLEEYFFESLEEEVLPNWILVKETLDPIGYVSQPVNHIGSEEEMPDDI